MSDHAEPPKVPEDKPAPIHHVVQPKTGGLTSHDPRTPPKPSS